MKKSQQELARFKEQHREEVLDELRRSSVLNNPEEAVNALEFAVRALAKLAEHMAGLDLGRENPCDACGRKGVSLEAAGKTTAYMAKVVNEGWRLLDFARGKADHRTEVTGVAELMKVLTDEQFSQVNKWYEEGLNRGATPGDKPDSLH